MPTDEPATPRENCSPTPWIPFYIPSQGWAACWKGQPSLQGVGPNRDLYPVCHMRWTDGLRPQIEERLEVEVRLICEAVNNYDEALAACKAALEQLEELRSGEAIALDDEDEVLALLRKVTKGDLIIT